MIKKGENILHPKFEESYMMLVIDTSEDCARLAEATTLLHCPFGA
jgi:hypothetical protein